MASDICPNCGKHDFNGKDPCRGCGYTNPGFKKLSECDMVFCNGCGCHYTDGCPTHPPEQQVKVKFK